jgi:hypothetical protein
MLVVSHQADVALLFTKEGRASAPTKNVLKGAMLFTRSRPDKLLQEKWVTKLIHSKRARWKLNHIHICIRIMWKLNRAA